MGIFSTVKQHRRTSELRSEAVNERRSRASKKFTLIFFSFTSDAVVRQRCHFKIHSLTRSSVSLGSLPSPHSIHSPGNPRTSFTPAHANLTASAKQSRPVIRLCNVVLRMTNVRQTRSIYETSNPKTCLIDLRQGQVWIWKIDRRKSSPNFWMKEKANPDIVRKPDCV